MSTQLAIDIAMTKFTKFAYSHLLLYQILAYYSKGCLYTTFTSAYLTTYCFILVL